MDAIEEEQSRLRLKVNPTCLKGGVNLRGKTIVKQRLTAFSYGSVPQLEHATNSHVFKEKIWGVKCTQFLRISQTFVKTGRLRRLNSSREILRGP